MKHIELHLRIRLLLCFRRLLLTCASLVLLDGSVNGLSRDRSISQLHHTAWTRTDGAPAQIRAIAQTKDGFLWLGTSTGLYRFDGVQFESYSPFAGGPSFPSRNIYSLAATADGGLLIGYWFGGVSILTNGSVSHYGESEGLPPGRVWGFSQDGDGTIWVAAAGGLARLRGARWERVGLEFGYPGKTAQAAHVDNCGTLWVATEDTVMFLPKGMGTFQPTGEKTGQVLKIVQAPDGAIWIAETSRSVRQLRLPSTDVSTLGPEIKVGSVSILFDREGALWIPTIGDGLRRLRSVDPFRGRTIGQFSADAEMFTEKDGLASNYVFTVMEDREGNIWLGSANGLDRFRASDLVPVRFPSGYQDFGLAAGEDGEVWTGSSNLGVNRITGAIPTRIQQKMAVSIIHRDRGGTIWAGGSDGVFRWNGDGFSNLGMPPGFKVLGVSAMFVDRAGVLWVYTDQEGAFTFKDGVWTRFDRQSQLPKSAAITGSIDSSDRKWLGYAANKLAIIDGSKIRTFSHDDGLRVGDVKVIHECNGHIWIGGSLGVALFENDRFRTLAAEGTEIFNEVSGIVESDDGSLWLNASGGVVHIPANEVRRFIGDAEYKISYRLFDLLDGLPGAAQQNRPFPTAVRGSDGRLWFSTNKGVAWIDPANIIQNPLKPPVTIRSIHADERRIEPLTGTLLPAGTSRLRVEFTALSLAIPERVRFRYRLLGSHDDWRDAGNRREVFYTNLGPGEYRFEVLAANPSDLWNERPAVIQFEILPAYYQTYWFYALCAVVAAGLFWLGYRWRVRAIESRLISHFRERLEERRRIAQDLHDDLLQGFVSASMQLNVVSDLLPGESNVKTRLEQIEEQLRNIVEKGREKVSNLRTANGENELYLDEALAEASGEIKGSYAGEIKITAEGEPRHLAPLLYDGVYHISREALINAIRHARAHIIEARISYRKNDFVVMVRDDGVGIDPETIRSGKDGHWGLSMMKERAEDVGATIRILTSPSSGTEIEIRAAARVAYATPRNIRTQVH